MGGEPVSRDELMMRAAVASTFGPPEVLEVRRLPRPSPGPGQLLVRVHAAGINPVDAGNRSDGSWAGFSAPFVVGSDASGTVTQIGPDVRGFKAGDEVFYFSPILGGGNDSCADYQAVDAAIVAPRPRTRSHLESAALPLAAGTAYELVVRRLAVGEHERVLIYAAAGGVGGYAVQLAKHAGATVLAVASQPHEEYLRTLGADFVFDYRTTDIVAAVADRVGEVDAIVDLVGSDVSIPALEVLRPYGRLATVVDLNGDFELAVDKNQTLHGVLVAPEAARLRTLADLADRGALRPPSLEVFELEEIIAAHTRIERGHGRGKVVIDVAGDG